MATIEEMVEKRASVVASRDAPQETTKAEVVPQTQPQTFMERAKETIGVMATEEAIKDEDLRRGITERKKAALLNGAEADMKREEAANKEAEILLQEANYGVYSGVANYAGIKRPLPKLMQSILFSILSAFQMLVLLIVGIPTSLLTITMDCVDSVIKKLGSLTRSAFWIFLVALACGGGVAIGYIVKFFITKLV